MPDVRVATRDIRVPVGVPKPKYTGRFISAKLAQERYAPGENVRVIIKVEVTRTAQLDPKWASQIIAQDITDPRIPRELGRIEADHVGVPWRADKETWDTDMSLGVMPKKDMAVRLLLYAGG